MFKAHLLKASLMMIAVTFCCVGQAQQAPLVNEKSEETKTGTISGRVVNESDQPLANAAIFLRAYGSGVQGRTTSSAGDGTFQISGLDPIAYTVSAFLPAYAPVPRDADSTLPTYFRVGDSVKLQLVKGAVITGTVTSSSGDPIVAVRVRAFRIRDANGEKARYEVPANERLTDDRGAYRIYGLSAGTYVVSAGGGGGFSGSIVSPYETDVPTYSPTSTRDSAAEITVRSGEETANVDIRYRGEQGHVVSGVASGGFDRSGVIVRLSAVSNGVAQLGVASFQPPGRGFSFNGVGDGDYDINAQSSLPGGDVVSSEHRRIKVRGADVTGIELIAQPLAAISGRIVLEESKAPECKAKRRPLFAETLVTPLLNEKNFPKEEPPILWSFAGPSTPDEQGGFTLRNLGAGQYRFNSRSLAKYWYLKTVSLQPSVAPAAKAAAANRPVDAARNWITLKSGDRLSELIVTFAEGAASFHGQIKLAEGQKLDPKLFTYLVPAEREKAEDVLRFFVSHVTADGTFALNNLPPGRYWVLAKPVADASILSKLRLPDEGAMRTKLHSEAEAARIEIDLKPCQNVTDYQLELKPR